MENFKKNILVIDDDANLLELISQVLSLHGMTCDTAENGFKALEMMKSKFYDLVISDIRMPLMTGTELLKAIHKNQANDAVKSRIILMTAYSTDEIIENADQFGIDDFLTKPFDINHFMERVNQLVGN